MLDVTGLNCWKCSQAGHSCPAQTTDMDEKPVCVFCADCDACPVMKRRPTYTPVPISDVPKREPRRKATTMKTTPDATPTAPTVNAKACQSSPCGETFPSGEGLGDDRFCSRKCQARQYYRDRVGKATKAKPGKKPKPTKAKRQLVPETAAPCEAPGVFTLAVREEHLDSFLLGLPAEKKYALVQAEIAASAVTPLEAVR